MTLMIPIANTSTTLMQ